MLSVHHVADGETERGPCAQWSIRQQYKGNGALIQAMALISLGNRVLGDRRQSQQTARGLLSLLVKCPEQAHL